jgi:hypothetical protein
MTALITACHRSATIKGLAGEPVVPGSFPLSNTPGSLQHVCWRLLWGALGNLTQSSGGGRRGHVVADVSGIGPNEEVMMRRHRAAPSRWCRRGGTWSQGPVALAGSKWST